MDEVFKKCPDDAASCELGPRVGRAPAQPAAVAGHQETFFRPGNEKVTEHYLGYILA